MAEGILKGKRGIVLGVANERSIAWACAQYCAEQGASLIFNYLGDALEKRVRKLTEQHLPGSPMYACDVSKDEEIASFFANVRNHWDSVDFIIHSVAYAEREDLKGEFINTPRANFALALDISAYSLIAVAREAGDLLKPGSSIAAMTYYGAEKVVPHYNVMGVAKAALEASSRYLAFDLGKRGVRVNCVSAGPVKTLSASAIAGARAMHAIMEETSPLHRSIETTEVAKTTAYLVSDLASAVTGEVLHTWTAATT